MNLHHHIKLFSAMLRAASQHLNIRLEFVEKDYWITLILSRLSESKFMEQAVFKGGTSLSKAYNLIDRFSEDVDIAIINDTGKSGNKIKTIIRTLEKDITSDLTEVQTDGVTSKGSRFRKSVFEYATIETGNANNKVMVEINSFANPFPFQRQRVQSMVSAFLLQTENEKYIDDYHLQPFEVNVLNKEQTLLEKMVALIRFSFHKHSAEGITEKIRHFYDLFYLMDDHDCADFIASGSFKERFHAILNHDRELFEEPIGWQVKAISESPLINDFPNIWSQLKEKYRNELSAFAYRPIPHENNVAEYFEKLMSRIQ